MILAVDPGPKTCGWVAYDDRTRRVTESFAKMPVEDVVSQLRHADRTCAVAIERCQSYGQSGDSLLQTSEVVGRLWQSAKYFDMEVHLIFRREVLRHLDVLGSKGNRDKLVRARLIQILGPKGTKKNPGPCFGVSSHAWQALGVAVTAAGH